MGDHDTAMSMKFHIVLTGERAGAFKKQCQALIDQRPVLICELT